MEQNKNTKSPCIDKCKYDEDKVCMGCHITMNEIVNWSDFSNTKKIEIITRVEKQIKKNI